MSVGDVVRAKSDVKRGIQGVGMVMSVGDEVCTVLWFNMVTAPVRTQDLTTRW